MKIKISNLGTVVNAQIELKPLTLFVGDNSTGKTWTAYAISSLLGSYGHQKYLEAYLDDKTEFKFQSIEKAIHTLSEKGSASINLKEFLVHDAQHYLNEVALLVPQWLNSFMATKQAHFECTKMTVEFSPAFLTQLIDRSTHFGTHAIEKSVGQKGSRLSLNALKEKEHDNLYYYLSSNSADVPEPIKKKEVQRFVTSVTFEIIRQIIASNTLIFPTERTTFLTLPLPFIEQDESYQNENISKRVVLSEPVKDFLTMLNSAFTNFFARKKQQRVEPQISHFITLSHLLDNDILLGQIEFEDNGRFLEVLYQPTDKMSLEVKVSAAMIKELAPLSLYLKYLAQPNDLVIIDEPEMNLHPAAQAEMTEFMGLLVNAGLNLLMTTHSPYIVDHLVNLMRASDCDNQAQIKKHFYLEREESFISKEKVSVYLFDEGTAKNLLSENGHIEWDTFSDVSSDIAQIYSKMD